MRVCVAIPTYLREQVLVDTIEQVLNQDPPANEILVIDQTPEHEPCTEAALQSWRDLGVIRWISHSPHSLPGARNRALQETTCEIILFIDDDVAIPRDFVFQHLKNYADPNIAAIGGRVVEKNWQPPPRPKGTWPPILDSAFLDRSSTCRINGVGGFPGGNHSVRVHVLREIGGYDENYNVGTAIREESDAAARLWKAGYRIDFDPEAWLFHLAAPTGGCRRTMDLELWKKPFSSLYFAFRHLYPSYWFWDHIFYRIPRSYLFNRRNVLGPWRLPRALVAYIHAAVLAGRLARQRPDCITKDGPCKWEHREISPDRLRGN